MGIPNPRFEPTPQIRVQIYHLEGTKDGLNNKRVASLRGELQTILSSPDGNALALRNRVAQESGTENEVAERGEVVETEGRPPLTRAYRWEYDPIEDEWFRICYDRTIQRTGDGVRVEVVETRTVRPEADTVPDHGSGSDA